MILYASPLSSYSLKARLALCYKGVAVDMRQPPRGYRSPDYRALVPAGTIPALVDGDFTLTESDAIIEYLDERYPSPSLLPGDARDRARARMVSRLHDFRVEPSLRALFRELPPATRDNEAVTRHFNAFAASLALIDQVARPDPFLCGSAFTLADCGFPATLILARRLGVAFGWAFKEAAWFDAWDRAVRSQPGFDSLLQDYEKVVVDWIMSRQP